MAEVSCSLKSSSSSISVDSGVPDKVVIWFRPTGNAPILKQSKFKISPNLKFQSIIDFLRRQLHLTQDSDPLFLYLNSSFSPAPDEPLVNLYRCFAVDGMLIVNYSVTAAWG